MKRKTNHPLLVAASAAGLFSAGLSASAQVFQPPAAGVTAPLLRAPAAEAAPAEAQRITLSEIADRHLRRTAMRLTMGGAPVGVSGQFSRDLKNAFLVLYSPRFRSPLSFNLKGLLDQELKIGIGGTQYRLAVEPSVKGRMASVVRIAPAEGEGGIGPRIGELFRATYDSGHPVKVAGVEHRLFYFQDLEGELQGQPNGKRSFAFLVKDGDDSYGVSVVGEETVTEQAQEFKLGSHKALLRKENGVLEIR